MRRSWGQVLSQFLDRRILFQNEEVLCFYVSSVSVHDPFSRVVMGKCMFVFHSVLYSIDIFEDSEELGGEDWLEASRFHPCFFCMRKIKKPNGWV